MDKQQLPVTIITGFLGSGKTTLINNLIKRYPEKKFAIIENELGEIGLDRDFIVRTDETVFELSNGCICCSLNTDFYQLLHDLLTGDYDFNHLLIETTGIADPSTIIKAFVTFQDVMERFTIDSVVCLADAVNIEDLLDTELEARKQLSLADLILINKVDLVRDGYTEEVRERIESINPLAQVYSTSQADISEIDLLDTYQYSGSKVEKSVISFRNLAYLGNKSLQHDIKTVGISISGSLDYTDFKRWFETVLFFAKYRPYRVKGILSFKGTPERCILHAVNDKYVIEKGNFWETEESRFCKLVFIGKTLDKLEIEKNIERFRVK